MFVENPVQGTSSANSSFTRNVMWLSRRFATYKIVYLHAKVFTLPKVVGQLLRYTFPWTTTPLRCLYKWEHD